jgi:myxalamid-type polyketide synthase MxaB
LVQLGQQTSLRGVIHLWSLDCPDIESGEPHGKTAVSAVKPSCESALYLMQALTSVVLPRLPDCWFVTCGAESVGDRMTTQPLQACLWGLGKVFALEHPEFSTALIDLDPSDLKHAALELFNEIQSGVAAEQVSFCRDQRYIAQLVQLPQQTESPAEQSNPTRLEIGQRGTLENLNWQPVKRQSPAPDQVEIRVQATGLNFRDLLNALGRLPDGAEHYQYPGEAGLLGLECAGEVVAVGSEVKNFAIGDTVVAVAAGSFSQFVTVNAALVAHKPKGLDFTAAATMPTAFLTAFHALVELAQIKAGDRVLIHAAAGGVGQAAIQIAQQAGAEVLATAAPEKWSFLQAQGIQHVFNSRQFDVDAVMNATKNQGVDIVLNSLTGEAISQSLSVLRSMGRFVEIGKTDVWQPAQVAAARPDIKYFLVDLFELTQQQPERIQAMMKQLLPQFQDQRLKPLPQTVFPTAQAIDAFRYMQQAKHIGKIVIRQPEIRQSNSLAPLTRFQIREDGAYLITGGLGGLGLELAEWLISRGAAYLILVNRSAPSASVQTTLEQLQQRARVDVIQADISDATQAANLLANSAPLLGIFHAAGTLADAALEQQTWNHFETVMAAKVQGAWNLHYLTREMQLDCFVLFSSAASLIGSAGQANYAAANAFLDALSHYRQQLGLPSLSINWGGWSQVGMTAERQLEAEMVAKGLGTIPPEQGLTALEYLLDQPLAQVGVLPIDWSSWQAPAAAFFREVARAPEPKPLTMQPMLQLKHLSPSECRSQLIAYLNAQVGKILGIEAASIDPQQGLTEIGIDSLTSVELRNLLQTHLNCRLPSTLLFDYPTIAGLAEHLINLLLPEAAQSSQQTAQQTAQQMVKPETAIAHLSEAEAEALLLQELEQLEN